MNRRGVVAGIAGAVVCPTFGGGQQLNVPVIGFIRSSTKAGSDPGGLLSYGTSQREAHYRAGTFVARILNGERPSDIPVEVISKFDLALNAKTATQLKLTIPPTLLARADEVIE